VHSLFHPVRGIHLGPHLVFAGATTAYIFIAIPHTGENGLREALANEPQQPTALRAAAERPIR